MARYGFASCRAGGLVIFSAQRGPAPRGAPARPEAACRLLHPPPRTLARRKKDRRLRADESDRLLRLGRVAARAEEVLGTADKAARWLGKPNRALGGKVPLAQLDTDIGAHQVEEILGRIAHGLYS